MCRFFGFKLCTITTFMILLKPHVWRKSGSRVKDKNTLGQSDCKISKLWYLKIIGCRKLIFCYKIDDVILREWGQECPKMLLKL